MRRPRRKDNEEFKDKYQTIRCLTFLESRAQAENDNKEAKENDKEEDEDDY